MSYLSGPRINFAGFFQADVSTINNDVRFYDSDKFKPQYQEPSSSGVSPNGGWRPQGTGIFRLLGCQITGGWMQGELITSPDQDPVIGMALEVSDERVAGKLVDLDPQQQAVSEIWGMSLRLRDDSNSAYFEGNYGVAAFINLWFRQQHASAPDDQQLASVYQSVLEGVSWSNDQVSPLLQAVQNSSEAGLLSINFNVYGYGRDPNVPRYTLGRMVGSIGPAHSSEPRHFVLGRQMMAPLEQNITVPKYGVGSFQCQVDVVTDTISADFGNALPVINAEGELEDVGDLYLAVSRQATVRDGATLTGSEVEILGSVPYQSNGWYSQTAGIETFEYASNAWVVSNIGSYPVLLLKATTDGYQVVVQESIDGLYARADAYVCRLNPGESRDLDFYTTRYGKPFAAAIEAYADNDMIGGAGTGQKIPDIPVPVVGKPTDGIDYPDIFNTDNNGKGSFTITAAAAGPGNPRGYIDGQVYGIGYALSNPRQPADYNSNPWNFISVLAFDDYPLPDVPTWHQNIQAILTQYGNLYPIMSKHVVDLGNYDSVVAHANILQLAFSLPHADPNFMPVTRDLSAGKQATLLKWLDNPGEDGLPLKGDPALQATAAGVQHVDANVAELNLTPIQASGKTDFLMQLQANKRAEKGGDDHD